MSVGQLHVQKDHKTLILSMVRVVKEFPDVRLEIFGDGPLREMLLDLIKENSLENNITLRGIISDIDNYLIQADLFVLPSLFEGFPNALLEAMTLGIPSIASQCSGNIDLIEDEVCGKLFAVGDADQLADQIIDLLSNYTQCAEYSRKL